MLTVVTTALAAVPVPPSTAEAIAFSSAADLLWIVGRTCLLGIPAVLLFSGLAGRLRFAVGRMVRGRRLWTATFCAAAFMVIFTLMFLPVEYALHRVLVEYRLSSQNLAQWMVDQGTGLAIKLVVVVLVAWVPYLMLVKSPGRWWLWSSALLIPFVALLFVVQPWLDPLFNTYKPLANAQLEGRIAALAARGGLSGIAIVAMHSEGDSNCSVACVTGLGPSRRIVINDTAISRYSEREILSVVGHEMKHYVKDDNIKAFVIASMLIFAGFWTVRLLGRAILDRWSGRLGFSDLADPASVPLLVFCFSLVYTVADPFFLAYARHVEFEADRYGLELTQDNEAAATTLVKDTQLSPITSSPDWFAAIFRENHPSVAERIAFANTYHPWLDGKPLVYGDDFVQADPPQ